ncbi:endo-1,4-beta-xylanase [Phenylobacterium montanum]|uniref:Beta-xylanase n=1 Tax=Phenylobacterium montanum TaxID=2823693 RepID=A0A975IX38_9CAUL|nr:endo-1,4-beta-xylanase [Caulobacter sp. S6]QUD90722.1 endo-1,4-beta-xylanase [Caulobacter sp. S6]
MRRPVRRTLLGGLAALPLAACAPEGHAAPPPHAPDRPLKSFARFPVGCAVTAERLADPADAALIARHFSQLTPEWEMKMEYILQDDGTFRFDAPDAIAGFAHEHGLRLFGHNLVWYAQNPVAFRRLDGKPKAFADAYRNYILAVAGRYAGQAVGWDVVNEAVAEDGNGLRACLWSRNLGQIDYIRRAFDHAHEADPTAVLFINDYNLESLPKKRASFVRLVEKLLQAGAPVGGVGTQTHIDAGLEPGALRRTLGDLADFGLPIHVSELDISLNRAGPAWRSRAGLAEAQLRLAEEAAEAFSTLAANQRFAFTLWGLKDGQSWLRSPKENRHPPWDAPLAFDDAGRRKPVFDALAAGFAGQPT